jgi:tetratricopeptide (TPR) repeat protein
MRNLSAKAVTAAIAIAAIAATVPVQKRIDSVRTGLVESHRMPTHLPSSAAISAALGGFRGIAVDILWLQAESMLKQKQFYQLMTYYEIVSVLQPNFPSVWTFNAWNLCYNISHEWPQPEEKWVWIKKGIDFGDKGLTYNPDSAELWSDIGWFYMHKVGEDPYFARRLEEEEGKDANLVAAQYFKKALDIAHERGELDQSYSRLYARALYRQGETLRARGNIPGALEYFTAAEETRSALEDFPNDLALTKMLIDIRMDKQALVR